MDIRWILAVVMALGSLSAGAEEKSCPRGELPLPSSEAQASAADALPLPGRWSESGQVKIVERQLTLRDGVWISTLGYDQELIDFIPSRELQKKVLGFFDLSLYNLDFRPQDVRADFVEQRLIYPLALTFYYRDYKHSERALWAGNSRGGPQGEIRFVGEISILFAEGEARSEVHLTEFTDEKKLWEKFPLGVLSRKRVFNDKAAGPLCDYSQQVIEPILEGLLNRAETAVHLLSLTREARPDLSPWLEMVQGSLD